MPWPWDAATSETLSANVPAFTRGGYWDVVRANLETKYYVAADRIEQLRPLRVLAMFLIGAAGARLRLADPRSGGSRALPWLALICLPLALALAIGQHRIEGEALIERLAFVACETLAGPMMAIAYATFLLWLFNLGAAPARAACKALAPAGRMALTNYLGQSAIGVVLFYGWGLGLFAQFSLLWSLGIAGAIFAAQVLLSVLWLTPFRQGPLEWLWRWSIKGRRPKLLARPDHGS